MSYAVEIIVASTSHLCPLPASPAQRLPFLHDTIEDALTAGADFLRENGAYLASKAPDAAIALFQIVDGGGDIVIAPKSSA